MRHSLLLIILILSPLLVRGSEELDIRIPVVDMNDFYKKEKKEQFLKTLYDAMSQVGFFAVRNTGVN